MSFHVDRGEILGIVGESGSGKSQTAFSILGLLPDNARIVAGSIQFDGNYTVAPGEERVSQERLSKLRGKRISYIPQEPMSNLDPAFTIGYQLVTPMVRVLGISKAEARKRALKLLTDVGIVNPERTFNAYPHEVSGGMAQRVLIAGAISCEPDLVIADEPTTALDVTVQADVLDLLRELQQRLNIGVILVTHNFGVVADLCDRVAVMQNGRLVEEGPVRDILRNPQEPYTRTLLASMLEGKEPMSMLVSTPARRSQSHEHHRQRAAAHDVETSWSSSTPARSFRAKPFRALTDINITIGRGETLGLVGESGSGKTTLGRAILGLAPVTGGKISFDGKDISHATRKDRRVLSRDLQVVFQDPVHLAEPGTGDRRHPRRTPGRAGHGRRGGQKAREGTAGPGGPALRRHQPAAARIQRRPAPARGDRPRPGPLAEADRLR